MGSWCAGAQLCPSTASWGAPAEHKPQHSELELVTVTQGISEVEVATYTDIDDAAEHIADAALEEIVYVELASLPEAGSTVRAYRVKQMGEGLFYEILVNRDGGWIERQVVGADRAFYYGKEALVYLDSAIISIELRAVCKNGVLYYEVYTRGDLAWELGRELEDLLKREGSKTATITSLRKLDRAGPVRKVVVSGGTVRTEPVAMLYEYVGCVKSESAPGLAYHTVVRVTVDRVGRASLTGYTCECKASAFSKMCKHVKALYNAVERDAGNRAQKDLEDVAEAERPIDGARSATFSLEV